MIKLEESIQIETVGGGCSSLIKGYCYGFIGGMTSIMSAGGAIVAVTPAGAVFLGVSVAVCLYCGIG